ncbi:hypothetical protein [Enterococcus faecium]|uniref:hypothetical protein n=1 Tax=Enterococcus faecium TaxID=1352 RepID=UPI0015E80326|nr:hypothetical protein [Enterococcus faecium]
MFKNRGCDRSGQLQETRRYFWNTVYQEVVKEVVSFKKEEATSGTPFIRKNILRLEGNIIDE